MTVAIYLRKSRAEELSDTVDETLKRHRETLLEFAVKNQLTVLKIYEEVISGESLYARPQMLRLLADVENADYDAVLCMDIDRLGRGAMSDQGVILETLKAANTKIITPRKTYDLNNEMDETYSEFETFMARQELKSIKRRMQRGIHKTIEDGGYIANAPYGYRKVTANKRPTLAINEDEAKFVRMMFTMYVNRDMGCQHIADAVNAMGARPHRADQFGRTSILKILRNPVYIGKVVWGQKSHIKKGSKNNQKHITLYNPKEKWTVADGIHPPIVDKKLFNWAQEISSGRYHPPANTGMVKNPLAGLMYCKKCGAPMQRQVIRQGGAYLMCQKRGCTVSSSLPLVENAVLNALKSTLIRLELKGQSASECHTDVNQEILNTIESECKTAQRQTEKLYDLLEQGIYDIDTFTARKKQLNDKIVKLRNTKISLYSNYKINYDNISNIMRNALDVYEAATAQEKNTLLKVLIDKIIYTKEKGAKPAQFTLELYLKPLCF